MKKLLFALTLCSLFVSCKVNKDGVKTVTIGKYEYFGGNTYRIKQRKEANARKIKEAQFINTITQK